MVQLAAGNGSEEGKKNRGVVERGMTPAQIADAQRLSREFRPSAAAAATSSAAEASLVRITDDERVAGTGSGFFITKDGYLVTNAHVVEDGSAFKVLTATGLVPVRLIKRDQANDLAVLKVEGQHTALPQRYHREVQSTQYFGIQRKTRLCSLNANPRFRDLHESGMRSRFPIPSRGQREELRRTRSDPRSPARLRAG